MSSGRDIGSRDPRLSEEALMDELRRARISGKRSPDFFIVGHAKCGTTALYSMLKAHPRIYMPALKETQFLARDPRYRRQASKRHPQTLEEYLSLFEAASPEQCVGEASTTYLRSRSAAGRIAALHPDARIIAIFREPASFLRSLHLQLLQSGIETEPDFARALDLERGGRREDHLPVDPLWAGALLYSEHVRYVEQLRRYHEHFGRERVLALIYDDFRGDNERTVREVLRFLELDDSLEIQAIEANPTVRVRSPRVGELAHAASTAHSPLSQAVQSAVKTVMPRRLRREAIQAIQRMAVDRQPPPPDAELMGTVRARFKGEVAAASDYLDRDLVGLWGYDDD